MPNSRFHLNKWYLDFIGENGNCMIFYSAKLTWRGLSVTYASHINYKAGKLKVKSYFRNVNMPLRNEDIITWKDKKLNVSGTWKANTEPLNCRIFESKNGDLDWKCFQPSSKVTLKLDNETLEGSGYAEQLILTTPPWNIPMNQLRWGRFTSGDVVLVWIELQKEKIDQWVWLNGEEVGDCNVTDNSISSKKENFHLKLNRQGVLESDKKIYRVVQDLLRFLPGFGKIMPLNFLMADNYKWLSKAEFHKNGEDPKFGYAIHEKVNFNSEVT